MATILYKCPSCGGSLTYDPKTAKYRCGSCTQLFDESALSSNVTSDAETDHSGASVYSCPSCGARITAEATTSALRCYFCHSPLVLEGRFTDTMKPDAVLPFTVDREKAREEFLSWVKTKRFIPKDFYAPGAIDNLTGVYFPYWMADYTLDAEFRGQGQIVTHSSTLTEDITSTQIFDVMRRGVLNYRNITRGALKKADRKLADAVFPYPLEKMEPFKTGYLSGFSAESRDIESAEVSPEILREVQVYAHRALSSDARYTTLTGKTNSSVIDERYRYVLLPAWVFTYLGAGKNLYYFIMNGSTGEICGRLPISKGRLFLRCLLWGVLACALLCIGGWFLW